MSHTPGPWKVDTRWEPPILIIPASDANKVWGFAADLDAHKERYFETIAQVRADNLYGMSVEESRANAHLIAAAPLLLEAAEAAERFLNDPEAGFKDYLIDQLRTAINAAKGNQ